MKVGKGTVVSIDYQLRLGDGTVIEASDPGNPLVYLHGEGFIVPGLERGLEGSAAGETRQVTVTPEDGYGERDEEGVQDIPRAAFPAGVQLRVGAELVTQGPDGEEVPFVIRELHEDKVVVDLNHPLAGKTLHFKVSVLEVRAASAEELAHGHVHGAHCHH